MSSAAHSRNAEETSERERIAQAYDRLNARRPCNFFRHDGLAHVIRMQERYRRTLQLLRSHGITDLSQLRILDVGCGTGDFLAQLSLWGAQPDNLAGIELRDDAVAFARRLNPVADVRCGSAARLPWPDGHFDIVCQHTVFTSILDEKIRRDVAAEMSRVLRPGGAVLWYDFKFDNPRNPDVRGMRAGEIRQLFPGFTIDLRWVTLAPFVARRLPDLGLSMTYPLLATVPFLKTHYLGVFVRR